MAGDTLAASQRNQALVERLLDDLGKLMWSMTWDVANHDRWMLDPEEVHAELCLELVKLVNRYGNLKDYTSLKKVCVVSMRNRVADLATACYCTNRKVEARIISLDSDSSDDVSGKGDTDLEYYKAFPTTPGNERFAAEEQEHFDFDEYCDGMTDDAKSLIKEVLWPSERTMYFLYLTAHRKQTVSPKGFWTLSITPVIMARSLGWTMGRLKTAWAEVSCVVSGVDYTGGLVAKEDGR